MKSAITISIDKGLLRACRSTAYAARRTLSAQIEQWIDEKLALAAARPSPAPPSEAPRSSKERACLRRSGEASDERLGQPRSLPDPASPAAATVPARQRREAAA